MTTDGEADFEFKRYSVEMSIRKSFDGMQGSVEVPVKSYDAPVSGVWFGPYFDCQKRYMKTKTTLRMSYSVPIVYGLDKQPVGFVSVVVGSDLKWWKINPCETVGGRNMFGGLNRCDLETTRVNEAIFILFIFLLIYTNRANTIKFWVFSKFNLCFPRFFMYPPK